MTNKATRVMSDADMDAAERLAEARIAEARARPSDSDVEARVREFLRRPYRMEVRGNPEEGYLATAPELPGCLTAGETPEEALRLLQDAMATWIEAAIAAGDPVPQPDDDRYSGRMLLRIPKSLHARLAEQAGCENVSMNQFALVLLAESLVREPPVTSPAPRERSAARHSRRRGRSRS
jgi:antitoxin HicB